MKLQRALDKCPRCGKGPMIVDNAGGVWTIGSNTAILRNGVQAGTALGSKIYWKSSTIYVYGFDLNWWKWTGSTWVNIGPIQP